MNKNIYIRFALASAITVSIAGCGDLQQTKVAFDKRIIKIDSKSPIDLDHTGIAFMSLGSVGKCIGGVFTIEARSTSGEFSGLRFDAVTSNIFGASKGLIESPKSCVAVIGMSLPPGNYEISDAHWFFDLGTRSESIRSARRIAVPFAVKAGEATYLGSFQMVFLYGKDLFGNTVRSGGAYGVEDDFDRDLGKVRELRPELQAVPVKAQLPADNTGEKGFPRITAVAPGS